MKECPIHCDITLPAHHEAAEIPKPGEGPFNLPAPLVPSQLAPVLHRRLHPVFSVRADQVNATLRQALTQGVRIACFIVDEPLGPLARAAGTVTGDCNGLKGRLQQGHFGGGRRVQEVSQRNTLAVDHHHPLRAFASLRFPDARPPFFAGAKLPSAKASAQSSWPWASSSAKKARQALTHTPCSSQSRSRRQQVLGDGNRLGRSCHRAPARNIQRIPSKTGRFGIGFGPPRGEAFGSDNNGAILAHCSSVSSDCSLAIQGSPFAEFHSGRNPLMQTWPSRGYETTCNTWSRRPRASSDEVNT